MSHLEYDFLFQNEVGGVPLRYYFGKIVFYFWQNDMVFERNIFIFQ